jgi:hypothetical protein
MWSISIFFSDRVLRAACQRPQLADTWADFNWINIFPNYSYQHCMQMPPSWGPQRLEALCDYTDCTTLGPGLTIISK